MDELAGGLDALSRRSSSDESPAPRKGDGQPDREPDRKLDHSTTRGESANAPHNTTRNHHHSLTHEAVDGANKKQPHYSMVKVLLLTFAFTDLNLESETRQVEAAFQRLGYEVYNREIGMSNSLKSLQTALEDFLHGQDNKGALLIIYYHGHGGRGKDKKTLDLMRYAPTTLFRPPVASRSNPATQVIIAPEMWPLSGRPSTTSGTRSRPLR